VTTKNRIEEAVEWYRQNRPIYEALALSVQFTTEEVLKQKKVNYHSVTYRAKDIERYKEKALKKEYANPKEEIMDMAGVRVITYLDSDAKKAAEIITQIFEFLPGQTIDKAQELGTDKVGYRSIHLVGKFGKDRLALPENKKFENLCFEIQIRTILQHAWAEFEHDRNYKFKGVLPDNIKRRFSIVAGSLELVDWTFESIAHDIDTYKCEVRKEISAGDLSTAINSASLKVYLTRRLDLLIKSGMRPVLSSDEKIISALSTYGIKTIEELDKAIPSDFVDVALKAVYMESYSSFLIDLMIILDAKTYFAKFWNQGWEYLSEAEINVFKHYGVPIADYMKEYGILVIPESEYFAEEPPYDEEPPDEEPPDDEEPPYDEEPPPDDEEQPPDEEPPYDEEPPEEEQPPDDEEPPPDEG
jgi:putative GTP pyrophosphokinase